MPSEETAELHLAPELRERFEALAAMTPAERAAPLKQLTGYERARWYYYSGQAEADRQTHTGQAFEALELAGRFAGCVDEQGRALAKPTGVQTLVRREIAKAAAVALAAEGKAAGAAGVTAAQLADTIAVELHRFAADNRLVAQMRDPRTGFMGWAVRIGHPRVITDDVLPGPSEDGDCLWLDEAFACHLDSMNAGQFAAGVRDQAREQWTLGDPESVWSLWGYAAYDSRTGSPRGDPEDAYVVYAARPAVVVGRALLSTGLADRLEAERRKAPAMFRAMVMDRCIPAMTHQLDLPALTEGPTVIRDKSGLELAKIAVVRPEMMARIHRGLALFGSLHGHTLVRNLVHRSHDRWQRSDHESRLYNRVEYDGGWSGLAEAIGYKSRNNEPLKALLAAGQHVEWSTPHVQAGGLWTWTHTRGGRGKQSKVVVVLADCLSPGAAALMTGSTIDARAARRLVPELRAPPPVGPLNERSWGAVWTLHRLALVELVDQAEQLVMHGGVKIKLARWRQLAKQAGVPKGKLEAVLDAWQAGEMKPAEAPPLVSYRGGDRWTLADSHEAERAFIEAGGQARIDGRQRSKKGRQRKP